MPPMKEKDPYERVERPKGISDVPRYLKALLGGFFSRLFYTFGMVWKTGPWILIFMILFSVLTGILPLIGSLISREILNELQEVITERALLEAVGIDYKAAFFGSAVLSLLIFFFSYKLIQSFITRINTAVTRIAGEKVGKHVKLIIMEKSREVDIASFDMPEFYEKLENANREASTRPIHVLSSTFDVVSNGGVDKVGVHVFQIDAQKLLCVKVSFVNGRCHDIGGVSLLAFALDHEVGVAHACGGCVDTGVDPEFLAAVVDLGKGVIFGVGLLIGRGVLGVAIVGLCTGKQAGEKQKEREK